MSVSAEFLDRCATESGFPPATLEKVIRLGELAGDVGRHPFLGEVLALKGGTALNLRLEEPPRLSVDLDFNYIGAVDRQRMIEERPKVEAAVEELARRRSYRIQRSRDEHAGRKLYLALPPGGGARALIQSRRTVRAERPRAPRSPIRRPLLPLPHGLSWRRASARARACSRSRIFSAGRCPT